MEQNNRGLEQDSDYHTYSRPAAGDSSDKAASAGLGPADRPQVHLREPSDKQLLGPSAPRSSAAWLATTAHPDSEPIFLEEYQRRVQAAATAIAGLLQSLEPLLHRLWAAMSTRPIIGQVCSSRTSSCQGAPCSQVHQGSHDSVLAAEGHHSCW